MKLLTQRILLLVTISSLFFFPAQSVGQNHVGETSEPVVYTQEELQVYISKMIEDVLNNPEKERSPESIHYSCLAMRDYLIALDDPQKQDEFVNSLIKIPKANPGYKEGIVDALSGIIDKNRSAHNYTVNCITENDYNVRRAVAISLLGNGEYNLVKDLIIEEELFYLLQSFDVPECVKDMEDAYKIASLEGIINIAYVLKKYGDNSAKEKACEYVLKNAILNSNESDCRAIYVSMKYLTSLERDDLLPEIARFADDTTRSIRILSVDMLKVFHQKGHSQATSYLENIAENNSDMRLRTTAKSLVTKNDLNTKTK